METDFIRKTEKPVGTWRLYAGLLLLLFVVL